MEESLAGNFFSILSKERRKLFAGALLIAMANLLLIVNPLLFRQALIFLEKADHNRWFYLALSVVVLLITASFSAFCNYRMRVMFERISRRAEYARRQKLFDRITRQTASFFDRRRIGSLMSRLTSDVGAYRDVLGPGVLYPLFFLTTVIPAYIALFYLIPLLALVALIPLLIMPLLLLFIRHQLYSHAKRQREALADMTTLAQEQFSGIRLVKAYAREEALFARFEGLCSRFYTHSMRVVLLEGLFFPMLSVISKGTTIALVVSASALAFYASTALSVPDFITFMWIQSHIFVPVLMLGWVLPMFERGRAAYDRLYEIYQEPLSILPGEQALDRSEPAICFEGVSFTYPGQYAPALQDISLTIPYGKVIGITGAVGAGKSTLLALLRRDYDPERGEITVGGQPLADFRSLPSTVMVVEQSPFLFSATIKENLLLVAPEKSDTDLWKALSCAGLDETVRSFPAGLDTLLGERGVTLSGGQKQRLALARALLIKRPILALDDSFSSLDAFTEQEVFSRLRSDGTLIVITNRVALLEKTDEIYFFSHGKVVEHGRPAELLTQESHFAALAELQGGEDG